jgi:hypothetical protein
MKLLQVDTKGEIVADLGPPVPDDTPANLDIEVTAKSVSRPSLEVETEVHAHLVPRIEAHAARILSWDIRALSDERRAALHLAVEELKHAHNVLSDELEKLSAAGFVAKTTASSRKRAALRPGTAVKLRPDIHADTVGLFYAEDELASLTVAKVGESSVLLVTSGGREIGPLPFAHVELANG